AVSICSNGTPINLFSSLGGSPTATGTWSGGLTGGNLGSYDPALLASGIYTYTVTAAGCSDAVATVIVTESLAPVAGTNGNANVCETGSTINLINSLGGMPSATGTWSGSLTGGNLGTYDPSTFTPGTYTYTVTAAGCANATATVTVTETPSPSAGTNGNANVCENGAPIDLFSSLGGSPAATGAWSGGLTGGNLGTYNPISMSPGTFTYTVTVLGCADATATVAITEIAAPNAGSNGYLTLCTGTIPTNAQLFSTLGGTPDAGGSWSNSGLVYTYTVSPTSPCAIAATSTVTITETSLPIAPAAFSDTSYCSGDVMVDLNVVGGSGTFTWYSTSALTNVISSGTTIAPINILGITIYYVTETVSGCQGPADSVMITINACSEPEVEIVIPTAFTPDGGDNTNNYWQIPNIDQKHPNNKVFIYNRWGSLLFESTTGDYFNNQWDGKYKNESLPVGSYYYILYTDYEISNEVLKGIVSIIKD
ncbi:MAG: hypothetical protein RI883_1816, partial [Bacteroidota bacterium]